MKPVAESFELSPALLKALFEGRICALIVRRYCPKPLAQKAEGWIRKNSNFKVWSLGANGRVATDVAYAIGLPRQQALLSSKNAKKYSDLALPSVRKLRESFAPALSPLDRLRLELDELWPSGANISSCFGRKSPAGIVRWMTPSASGPAKEVCHIDGNAGRRIYSANIYLRMPSRGGELKIWKLAGKSSKLAEGLRRALSSHAAFDPNLQELLQEKLPRPVVIRPKVGDLILLDTSQPHSVASFSRGHRVSIQTFLELPPTMKDLVQPISVFS
jgi:hypothetical protein